VDAFLQHAQDILAVAAAGGGPSSDVAIVVDRQGVIRMVEPSGWSLAGLGAHYGAAAVFKVENRGQAVRVEGWERNQRCLVQRNVQRQCLADLPGFAVVPQAIPVALLPAA
jgi:hypothetical protein